LNTQILIMGDGATGTPGQLERLRRWIESLTEKRGNTFVLENRRGLLDQWERHMVLKTYDCC
jgi:hypothetical protein